MKIVEFVIETIDKRMDDLGIDVPNKKAPVAINMQEVESMYKTSRENDEDATDIRLKSGDNYIVLIPYSQALKIWKES